MYYGKEFGQLHFPKAGKEIVLKGHEKVEELKGKLDEREKALQPPGGRDLQALLRGPDLLRFLTL